MHLLYSFLNFWAKPIEPQTNFRYTHLAKHMDTPKPANDPYIKKDLRMLGITLVLIAVIFGVTAFLDAKTSIIRTISNKIHLATLNSK